MIDWLNLLSNSIWIISIAFALAIVSIAYYQSQQREEKLRQVLKTPKYILILNISGVVFCLGMALTSTKWWEILLWIVLMVLFSYQAWMVNRDRGPGTGSVDP